MVFISNKNLWLVTQFRIISEVEQYACCNLNEYEVIVTLDDSSLINGGTPPGDWEDYAKENVVIAQKYIKHPNKKKYQSFGTSGGC